MGLLRFLLAMSVIFSHLSINFLIGGKNAVQIFYMISGFLISYVLLEARTYETKAKFYLARFLRIYPAYAFVAILTLLIYSTPYIISIKYTLVDGPDFEFFKIYSVAPISAQILLTISNILLLFQDVIMFLCVDSGRTKFTLNFAVSDVILWVGLLVPQAWSLSLELYFYIIAPFVIVQNRLIKLLIFSSIALRVLFIYLDFGVMDPWTYRFFPTELSLFLIGSYSHQFLMPLYKNFTILNENISKYATLMVAAIYIFCTFIPDFYIKSFVIIALTFLVLPFAFICQRRSEIDKLLAELSFPLYLGHVLIMILMSSYLRNSSLIKSLNGENSHLLLTVSTVFFSIVFAHFLNRMVIEPMERFRFRFRVHS